MVAGLPGAAVSVHDGNLTCHGQSLMGVCRSSLSLPGRMGSPQTRALGPVAGRFEIYSQANRMGVATRGGAVIPRLTTYALAGPCAVVLKLGMGFWQDAARLVFIEFHRPKRNRLPVYALGQGASMIAEGPIVHLRRPSA